MIKRTTLSVLAAAACMTAAPVTANAAPSYAGSYGVTAANGVDAAWEHGRNYDRRAQYYNGRQRVYYGEPVYRNTRVWRGRDGRNYCRKKDGTTGLIIGAAGGALLGREIDGGYNRTTGTVLGAAAGALLGRAIARDGSARCR